MAVISVSPGLNTIQTGINAANNVSGDIVELAAGTYTFSGNNAMIFDSAVTGTLFTNLTVQPAAGVSASQVILDFAGCTFDAVYGGNAAGVTIKNMTWKGGVSTNASFSWIRDNVNSAYVGWTFDGIIIDAPTVNPHTRTAFLLGVNPPGAGLTIKNITTTANFVGNRLIDILGTNGDLNLFISNIDARLHGVGTLIDGVRLIDVRDARIDNVFVNSPTDHGVYIQSSDAAKGVFDVDLFNCIMDGGGTNTAPLLYAGHNSLLKVTKRVRFHGCTTNNSGSYGIEMEGGVEDSEILNCRVYNSVNNGIPIPDSNKNILVADCVIDGVTGALNNGIALVYGRRHRILRNTITNCYRGIRNDENGDIALENERNIIRDNIIYNCNFAYRVTAAAMPSGALSNRFGPNKIFSPITAYADTDSGNMTQAQFEAAFPGSIEKSDEVITASMEQVNNTYSVQQALNIMAGVTTHPYTTYSTQHAANILVGNSAGNPNKFSLATALNLLV